MRALVVVTLILAACGGHSGTSGTCGDGVVDPDEDCDGGPNCTTDCLFACVDAKSECPAAPACEIASCSADHACQNVGDPSQNGMSCGTGMACLDGACAPTTCGSCDDGDLCNGLETCGAGSQACVPGTPAANGTTCAAGKLCIGAVCTADRCGDGFTSAPEECDDANPVAGDGCDACKFSCVSTDPTRNCTPADACAGQGTCNDNTHVCAAGTPLTDGTPCTGGTCKSGTCTPTSCGNSVVDPGEACDHGANNGKVGDGCTSNCQFVCVTPATDCAAAPACEIASCTAQHTCAYVADAMQNGKTCGTNMTCSNGTCSNTTMPGCGNGVLEANEQCDDGNVANLDGCDATCKFEQIQRINTMAIPFGPDAYCTKDALGGAVVGATAQGQISSAITTGVNTGTITIMLDLLSLDDLSGATDPQLNVGILGGTPATGASTYDGSMDLDWWYPTDPMTIDATRTAKTLMPATLVGSVLNAGPTEISVTVNFAGVPVTMDMFATKIRATAGTSSAPTASANGMTPGHLPAEHVLPSLTSFGSMTGGELCGNTTAQSLANVLVPSVLVGNVCNQHYTTSNTLLDVYISGCTAIIIPEVKATQPDISRDGATYVFTANAAHSVISCTRNGAASTLAICLANAAYTSLFKFTSDRVIAK